MLEIIDSHFHIWNLNVLHLPWLEEHPKLQRSYTMKDYTDAYSRFDVDFKGGVYVEVDCDHKEAEDECIYHLDSPLVRAKIMRVDQLSRHMRVPLDIAGVREPLHIPSSKPGRCRETSFREGLEVLAKHNLVFESCNRVEELNDLYESIRHVPQAKVIINHCGNVTEITESYKKAMQRLGALPNVYCKVSGFAAEDAAYTKALLDFITDTFAHSRLLYASNFPVVELYSTFEAHLSALLDYFGNDPDFFAKNAKKVYRLNPPQYIGNVIKLRPEKADYYKALHRNPFPGVNAMIRECGITDYKIYNRDDLLFSLMEYRGDDFDYDMAKMGLDDETLRWWKETDPCQTRIEGATKAEWWADMDLVYDLNADKK